MIFSTRCRPISGERAWRNRQRAGGQRRSTPSGRSADVNVVLIGEHVAVATAQAADPTRNERGMEALQCAPVGNSSSFAVPPNMSPAIRSIKIRPNPGWAGDFTVGPSLSRQLKLTDFGAKSQRIVIFPAGTESAPYFEALVASSCKIMPNDCAAWALKEIEGPVAWIRASSSTNGINWAKIKSRSGAPVQF